jgi:hypothetical protein
MGFFTWKGPMNTLLFHLGFIQSGIEGGLCEVRAPDEYEVDPYIVSPVLWEKAGGSPVVTYMDFECLGPMISEPGSMPKPAGS